MELLDFMNVMDLYNFFMIGEGDNKEPPVSFMPISVPFSRPTRKHF